jgi:hypothetical protein
MTTEPDPREFLKRIMQISPDDAEEVREASPATRKRRQDDNGQHGPTADYGDDDR